MKSIDGLRGRKGLTWLTTTDHKTIGTLYLVTSFVFFIISRASWQRTARRGEELRAQYETRYRRLRQRLLGWVLLGCALAFGTVLVALSAG
ncbi:hypothetical protein B7767_24545 [Streptomyces sp. 13-12-16]|nr:hypothetical protein B7767_24545 [Streptomyces sp. 13-12-16]